MINRFYISKNILAGFGTLQIFAGCPKFIEPVSPFVCIKTILFEEN